jgi:coenzyme F420-reducing hydrogenase gamma subunit
VHFPELKRVITSLLSGRFPEKLGYPVCLECKFRENECVLIKDKPCLGPITQAGCKAICIAQGKYCYGCQGPTKEANLKAIDIRLKQFLKNSEIKNYLNLFLKATPEFTTIKLSSNRAKGNKK